MANELYRRLAVLQTLFFHGELPFKSFKPSDNPESF